MDYFEQNIESNNLVTLSLLDESSGKGDITKFLCWGMQAEQFHKQQKMIDLLHVTLSYIIICSFNSVLELSLRF